MALKTFGLSVVIGGAIGSSFKSSFKTANGSLANMRNNIKGMEKTKFQMKSFQALSKDAKANKEELFKLGTSLRKSGIDIKNIDSDSRHFRLSLIKLKKASKIQIKIEGAKEQFAMQKASILGIGAALYGVTSIISSANDVLKSQGEIKSLGIAKAGINSITKAANKMSLQYGQITAPEFIKASYDIKSGIASLSDEGVKDMTKFAATTAVATKSSTEEMTKLYALGYGIFRKDFGSDMDFGKKFSGAIAGAVQAFRTDGSDLSRGISNIGASAHAMGVSLEEELAIVGLSKGAFDSASEAGSGYRAFLDGTGKAQKELGLSFVDANGKMLPMVDILGKIKDKYGDLDLSEIDQLKKAFGSSEAVKTITALLPKTEELAKAQRDLKKSMDSGLSKSEQMAKAMDSGYGFEKMSHAMSFMSYTIGKTLTPVVDVLATGLGGVAKGISWLDEKVPALIPVLSGVAFGFLGVVTVLKSYSLAKLGFSLATNTLKKALLLESSANNISALSFNRKSIAMTLNGVKTKALSLWSGVLATKTKAMTLWNSRYAISSKAAAVGSQVFAFGLKAINLVLSNTPLGWFIKGLTLLAGVGTLLYNKFKPFRELMDGIGKTVGGFFDSVGSFFGFGGDDTESKKPANNPKFEPAKAMKRVAVATAMTTSLAVAHPIAPLATQNTNIKNVQTKQEKKESHAQNNTYNITLHIKSDSKPHDISQAVKKAITEIESSKRDRSFNDEEI